MLLDDLVAQLKKQKGVTEVVGYTSPFEAITFLKDNTADVAILDIRMPGMNGLVLAKKLKELRSEMKIIFLTAYSEYAVDAFKLRASGYLIKPPTDKEIAEELNYAIEFAEELSQKRLTIKTFGNFEVLANYKPIRFARSKSKEILAYLVDRRGASVTKKEVAAIIWEDEFYSRSRQIQLETLIRDLIKSLQNVNADGVVLRSHGTLAV